MFKLTRQTNPITLRRKQNRAISGAYMLSQNGCLTEKPNITTQVKRYIALYKRQCKIYRLQSIGWERLFLKGEDVHPNSTYALYWLEEAVKDDNPYAEYLLGKVYLKGEYVDKDIEKAIELLKSSADQNNKYAAYTLGKLYLDGTTAPQDIEQALKYLTRSADNGFATAQYLLGKLLYSGELMPININKSLEYLLSAAEQADPFAAYLAGKIMLNEDSVKNIKEAVRCFEIAAEQGNSYAEYQLGKIYLYGVDNDKDYSQALGWLTASAEHAILTLSDCFTASAVTEISMLAWRQSDYFIISAG